VRINDDDAYQASEVTYHLYRKLKLVVQFSNELHGRV